MKYYLALLSIAAFIALSSGAPNVQAEPACTRTDSWKEDCNTCFCSKNGLKYCTRMECVEGIENIETKSGCNKEGATWKEDCNTCTCSNGLEACTRVLCEGLPIALPAKSKRSLRVKRCVEDSTWKEDCHTCMCKGGRPACTRELCESEQPFKIVTQEEAEKQQKTDPTHINFDKDCKPGDLWKEGCNSCSCTKDGKPACTKKLCPPKHLLNEAEKKAFYE